MRRHPQALPACLAAALLAAAAVARAALSVDVVLPASVTFTVTNVAIATTGSPNPTTVTWSNAKIPVAKAVRFSVMADAASFTPPSGNTIPAARVSWTVSNAQNGTGANGTLSASAWTQVFQSVANPSSGSFDVTWTLAAVSGLGIRSGTHTLTLRWKIEVI